MSRLRLALIALLLPWGLAGCPWTGNTTPEPEVVASWSLRTSSGGLEADGSHVVFGDFCPQDAGDPPSGIVARFRADAPSPAQVSFDPPTADRCTEVRITISAPGFAGAMRLALVAELTGGPAPSIVAPFELQGAPAPAGCNAPPTAADRWRPMSEPLALNARLDPALGLIEGAPVMARLDGDLLRIERLDVALRRWVPISDGLSVMTEAGFVQFVARDGEVDLAFLDDDFGPLVLFVYSWDPVRRAIGRDQLTHWLPMTRPRALQVQRTANGLFVVSVDASTLQLSVWRAPPQAELQPVTLPPEMADSGPYALATDVDAEGRLLIAFDRLVPGEDAVVSQVEVWRQVGESGFERLGPAVEAQRGRGAFDIPVIQDLALRATDPATGRALVLAWTQGNTSEGQRVMDWRIGEAAWSPLGDWSAGVRTEPLPYGGSTQGRSLALDCTGLPVMGWVEPGPDYPATLSWAAAYTGTAPSGWLPLPAVPPEAVPSPGRMRLIDRPGQRPLALRWHLGGWGDEARVDVLELGP